MRATLPLYTSAARAQNRVEVGSELMTSTKRFGGTRARLASGGARLAWRYYTRHLFLFDADKVMPFGHFKRLK